MAETKAERVAKRIHREFFAGGRSLVEHITSVLTEEYGPDPGDRMGGCDYAPGIEDVEDREP
jgi:hypothetical protein